MDPRGFPTTLPEFQAVFPDDKACAKYLENLRWPQGFLCPKCNQAGEPYRFAKRTSIVLRCRLCLANVSLTASTVMKSSHTPLSVWFWAAYLVTTQTPGQSALQFQRQLGLSRYETAFQLLHKLRSGMVRPEREPIGLEYPVELDEVFVGGRTKGQGKGIHHMATVVGAIEIRQKQANKNGTEPKRKNYAGRLRLHVIANRESKTLTKFVQENVAKGAIVRTDGWRGYNELPSMGYRHEPLILNRDSDKAEAHLPTIHIAFSNLKTWLLGTHHGVSHQHLQAYLNEFVFRFNRRFYPMTAFNSVLGLIANSTAPTYEMLYSRKQNQQKET
jgi:transposase-like protein